MQRLVFITGMILAPTAPLASDPAAEGQCTHAGSMEVQLAADELHLDGFDVLNGLVGVSAAEELEPREGRPRALRLHEGRRLLVPVPRADIPLLVEAHREGTLCATLRVRHWNEASCDDLVPTSICVGLKDAETPVACWDLEKAPRVRPEPELHVWIGTPHAEGPPQELPVERLREKARDIGEGCLREVMAQLHALQGAMSVQLSTTPLGQPERPQVVVDGLVNKPLSHCLVQRLFEERAVWQGLPPGMRMYVPFYFRGARPTSADSVLPVDLKAP